MRGWWWWALWLPAWAHGSTGVGLWSAAWPLGDGSPVVVVSRLDEVWGAAHGLSEELVVDEETSALLRRVRAASLSLDLARLHRMLPEEAGEERSLRMHGTPIPHVAYRLGIGPPSGPAARCGGLLGALQMAPRPATGEARRVFRVDLDLGVTTGDIGHDDLVRWIGATLDALHREATPGAAALAVPLRAAWPSTVAAVDRYAALPELGHADASGLDLAVTLDVERGRAGWAALPHLGAWLDRLGDLVAIEARVLDPEGRELAAAHLDSRAQRVGVRGRTAGGAVIPTRAGQPAGAARTLASLSGAPLRMELRGAFVFQGVRVTVEPWTLPVSVSLGSAASTVRIRIDRAPVVRFSGESGFVSWLLEVVDDVLDLEAHAGVLLGELARGPDGAGSWIEVRADPAGLALRARTTLADNGLVRFAMQIVGHRLMPSDPTVADMLTLVSTGLEALGADWLAVRPRLLEVRDSG